MFIDRLGQPVVVGSLVFDEQLGCLLVVMRFIERGCGTFQCDATVLESSDMRDQDLCRDINWIGALRGFVIEDVEVLYDLRQAR